MSISQLLGLLFLAAACCMVQAEEEGEDSYPPLDVQLFYESMCPFCRHLITTQIYPVYQQLTSAVLNLTLVPYGWARERWHNNDWQFQCQHGHKECVGNQIHACVLNMTSNDADVYMPFIACMEKYTAKQPELTALHECAANSTNIPEDEVITCMNSLQGRQLLHEMGVLTNNQKDMTFAPWLIIDGHKGGAVYQQAYTNFLKLVCDMYKGPTPTACKDTSGAPITG